MSIIVEYLLRCILSLSQACERERIHKKKACERERILKKSLWKRENTSSE